MSSTSKASGPRSITSRPNRRPVCSAATPTGAAPLVPGQLPGYRALKRFYRFEDSFKVEYPTGSGQKLTLEEIAHDLSHRLTSIFLVNADGRRPSFGGTERFQTDPAWKNNLFSTSTSMATTGPGWGLLTKLVGQGLSLTSSVVATGTLARSGRCQDTSRNKGSRNDCRL